MARIYFLGTGTSSGVPQIGCQCPVCLSHDLKDSRLRTSILYQTDNGKNILFDCGPDFRTQMLRSHISSIDAIFLTHEHFDHIGGLEELRPFSVFGNVPVYADSNCCCKVKERLAYLFQTEKYPGIPSISLNVINSEHTYSILGQKIQPVEVMHGKRSILGFRLAKFAYITDMSSIYNKEKDKLKGVKILIINALRQTPHHSHQMLSEALEIIKEVHPEESYIVHMSHQMGLHEVVDQLLPENVHLAYDGEIIDV